MMANSKNDDSKVTSKDLIADIGDNTIEMLRILLGYENLGSDTIKVRLNIGSLEEPSFFTFYNINNVHKTIDFQSHCGTIFLNEKMYCDIDELKIIVADVFEKLATRH